MALNKKTVALLGVVIVCVLVGMAVGVCWCRSGRPRCKHVLSRQDRVVIDEMFRDHGAGRMERTVEIELLGRKLPVDIVRERRTVACGFARLPNREVYVEEPRKYWLQSYNAQQVYVVLDNRYLTAIDRGEEP